MEGFRPIENEDEELVDDESTEYPRENKREKQSLFSKFLLRLKDNEGSKKDRLKGEKDPSEGELKGIIGNIMSRTIGDPEAPGPDKSHDLPAIEPDTVIQGDSFAEENIPDTLVVEAPLTEGETTEVPEGSNNSRFESLDWAVLGDVNDIPDRQGDVTPEVPSRRVEEEDGVLNIDHSEDPDQGNQYIHTSDNGRIREVAPERTTAHESAVVASAAAVASSGSLLNRGTNNKLKVKLKKSIDRLDKKVKEGNRSLNDLEARSKEHSEKLASIKRELDERENPKPISEHPNKPFEREAIKHPVELASMQPPVSKNSIHHKAPDIKPRPEVIPSKKDNLTQERHNNPEVKPDSNYSERVIESRHETLVNPISSNTGAGAASVADIAASRVPLYQRPPTQVKNDSEPVIYGYTDVNHPSIMGDIRDGIYKRAITSGFWTAIVITSLIIVAYLVK